MVLAKQNELTYARFTVFDTDGLTPLTGQAGACTSYLAYNNATAAEAVSIAEVGVTGHYHASFTPLSVGKYDLEVTCPDDRVLGDSFEVHANDLDDIVTEIDANETKIDALQADVTLILEDTGTTIPATLATLATEANATTNRILIIAEVDANEAKLDIIDTVVEIL